MQQERAKAAVLVVDDELIIARYYADLLELMGYEVCGIAATAEEAIALALRHRPHAILMDVRLAGDRDGVDAANAIHAEHQARIVFITGSAERATQERIQSDHPSAVLIKPVLAEQLRETLKSVLR